MSREIAAQFGGVQDQLYLANYNYMIGDYAKSYYFYEYVTENKKAKDTDKALAYNNLGYMAATGKGIVADDNTLAEYTLEYFQKAIELEEDKTIAYNVFALLVNRNFARDEVYPELLEQVKGILEANDVYLDEYEVFEKGYSFVGTFDSKENLDEAAIGKSKYLYKSEISGMILEMDGSFSEYSLIYHLYREDGDVPSRKLDYIYSRD
jgi:hypothetical protein